MLLAAVHLQRDGAAVGVAQRGLEGFGEALAHVIAHLEPVDDDVDAVFLRLREFGQVVDLVDLAVHAQAGEPLGAQFGEEFELLALAVGDHRGEDHQLAVGRQGEDVVDHLRHGLRRERVAVFRAVGRSGAGKEQAQVVVDFGDGADRRAWVVAGRLLLDRNCWREAFDQIDVGLVHHLQELPGVGRERLDVAALAFGVERVEGERRLARTRETGDHDQAVARQVEVDVFQVVRARAAYPDVLKSVHGGAVPVG